MKRPEIEKIEEEPKKEEPKTDKKPTTTTKAKKVDVKPKK